MKAILAIDSFKGCLNQAEANQAAAEGVRSVYPNAEVVQLPVSDGGEGFLDAFHAAIGGKLVEVAVCDPLMRPITAKYLLHRTTAVIEMAQASGLTLLTPDQRNPLLTTSYGTGQLVMDAVSKGARHVIVGLGGSATSDAGMGMLEAIHQSAVTIPKDVRFTIATDVTNPLCGVNGAAHVFAPQKGATPEAVLALDERARAFAAHSAQLLGYDRSQMPGAGAAGGLGYAFMQYLDAQCKSGIDLLLETLRFDQLVNDADIIITGEGSADLQTLMGKVPTGILRHAGRVPVCLIAGQVSNREDLLKAGFSSVECIHPQGITPQDAMRKDIAMQHITNKVREIIISRKLRLLGS
ncbi:MAG: glycerate kinase [Bacteroidaceae bacterium]|nr:glycerate kinase [Bacteroidaceae bacterium]